MKKALIAALAVIVVVCAGWQTLRVTRHTLDAKVAKFNGDADALLLGLQQYKEFTGTYPAGNNLDIAKALSGQTDKKVFILAVRQSDRNQKGELVDPWGTPLQFYISGNSVLIRSAGPDQAWEDSSKLNSDDLYRSN